VNFEQQTGLKMCLLRQDIDIKVVNVTDFTLV